MAEQATVSTSQASSSGVRPLILLVGGLIGGAVGWYLMGQNQDYYKIDAPSEEQIEKAQNRSKTQVTPGQMPSSVFSEIDNLREWQLANKENQRDVERRNTRLAMGLMGLSLGAVLGLSAGLVNKSIIGAIVGLIAGAVLGGAGGAGGGFIASHLDQTNFDSIEGLVKTLLMHGTEWVLIGVGAGLACGLAAGSISAILGGVGSGVAAGIIAPVLYTIPAGMIFSEFKSEIPIPEDPTNQFVWVMLAAASMGLLLGFSGKKSPKA